MKIKGLFLGVLMYGVMIWWPAKIEAIILLPAVILVPIAKIVAIVMGISTIPTITVSSLLAYFKQMTWKKALLLSILALGIIGLSVGLFLKFTQPDRPWY